MDVSAWPAPLFDAAAFQNYRRPVRVAPNFLYPGVDPKISQRALACAPSRCSAILEAAAAHQSIGSESPTDTSAEFWRLAESSGCDGRLVRKMREYKPIDPVAARGMLLSSPTTLETSYGPPTGSK